MIFQLKMGLDIRELKFNFHFKYKNYLTVKDKKVILICIRN